MTKLFAKRVNKQIDDYQVSIKIFRDTSKDTKDFFSELTVWLQINDKTEHTNRKQAIANYYNGLSKVEYEADYKVLKDYVDDENRKVIMENASAETMKLLSLISIAIMRLPPVGNNKRKACTIV